MKLFSIVSVSMMVVALGCSAYEEVPQNGLPIPTAAPLLFQGGQAQIANITAELVGRADEKFDESAPLTKKNVSLVLEAVDNRKPNEAPHSSVAPRGVVSHTSDVFTFEIKPAGREIPGTVPQSKKGGGATQVNPDLFLPTVIFFSISLPMILRAW